MEKKPINIVVRNATQAAKELNEIVEQGGAIFDLGVNPEYVNDVVVHSDGSKETTKEQVYRVIGFVDMYVGDELYSLNAIKDELKEIKKERVEMNRTLNLMNKPAFAPLSIFLLIVAIITLAFGILTIANVLPLPAGQLPIAIVLIVVGVLALAGSITAAILRGNKKKELLAKKDEVLNKDNELKNKEAELDNRTPKWYKDALWVVDGDKIKNAQLELSFRKKTNK